MPRVKSLQMRSVCLATTHDCLLANVRSCMETHLHVTILLFCYFLIRCSHNKPSTRVAGVTSENVAAKYGIARELQDKMAVSSHQRAAKARDTGRFKEEIVPVKTMWKDPKTGTFPCTALRMHQFCCICRNALQLCDGSWPDLFACQVFKVSLTQCLM